MAIVFDFGRMVEQALANDRQRELQMKELDLRRQALFDERTSRQEQMELTRQLHELEEHRWNQQAEWHAEETRTQERHWQAQEQMAEQKLAWEKQEFEEMHRPVKLGDVIPQKLLKDLGYNAAQAEMTMPADKVNEWLRNALSWDQTKTNAAARTAAADASSAAKEEQDYYRRLKEIALEQQNDNRADARDARKAIEDFAGYFNLHPVPDLPSKMNVNGAPVWTDPNFYSSITEMADKVFEAVKYDKTLQYIPNYESQIRTLSQRLRKATEDENLSKEKRDQLWNYAGMMDNLVKTMIGRNVNKLKSSANKKFIDQAAINKAYEWMQEHQGEAMPQELFDQLSAGGNVMTLGDITGQ